MRNQNLKDLEDMKVWQDAQNLAAEIYQDSAHVISFSFSDQMKRAGISIANHIAEGAKRASNGDFSQISEYRKRLDWGSAQHVSTRRTPQAHQSLVV